MSCPNCGAYRSCYCTWEEQRKAIEIRRKQAKEHRRRIGNPTVVEAEEERQREARHAK